MRDVMDKVQLQPFFRQILVIGLFCLGIATAGFAAEPVRTLKNHAKSYYWGQGKEQNYSKALQLYLQAAQLGDAEAQYISGGMYLKGLGCTTDFAKAFKLLLEAAQNGKSSAESEQIIGQAFLLGSGVPKNYSKALHFYTLAAENGNRDAQNELAFMYFVGNGVEQNTEKGAALFLKAAYNGLVVAQYNVGIMYYTGKGVKTIDLEKSYGWLNLAASKGHQPARAARDYLETVLAKDELAAAQSLSEELVETTAP